MVTAGGFGGFGSRFCFALLFTRMGTCCAALGVVTRGECQKMLVWSPLVQPQLPGQSADKSVISVLGKKKQLVELLLEYYHPLRQMYIVKVDWRSVNLFFFCVTVASV